MKKRKRGQPAKIGPEERKTLLAYSKFGLTDKQLAEGVGINEQTLTRYKRKDPDFCRSLKENKDLADSMVRKSLFKLALGYEYYEDMANKDGAVRCLKYAKPDVTACIFWLKNRQPEEWRDKHEHDLGKGATGALEGLAKIFAKGSAREAERLASGEDPSLVYFGIPSGRLGNVGTTSPN